MKTDYDGNTSKLLEKMGITFKAELIGSDCPTFCQDAEKGIDKDKVKKFPRKTHIHGKHYLCIFARENKPSLVIDFWNSYNDEEFNYIRHNYHYAADSIIRKHGFDENKTMPFHKEKQDRTASAYDVLACIQKYEVGTFKDFCSEFGYDTDSRKAETIYQAVVKEWEKVCKFFTAEELPLIQEIQ